MKKVVFNFVAAVSMLALIFAGCQDKDYYEPPTPPVIDGGEPSLLDFSTTQDVLLNISYADAPAGLISVFDVYAENPMQKVVNGQPYLKSGLAPIAGGIMVGGKLQLNKTIPAGTKELFLYSPDLFIPSLLSAKVENGMANFAEVDLASMIDSRADTRALGGTNPDGYLNNNYRVGTSLSVNTSHRPTYIDKTGTIENALINRITSAFPNEQKADAQYYKDAVMELYEEAEIWVSVIHSDGNYDSALSYFCFNGTEAELANASRSALQEIVAFPRAKLSTSTNGLKRGQYVKLLYYNGSQYVEKFPKGVTIGFALRADGYNTSNRQLKTPDGIYFSYNAWNPEPAPYSKQHTIFFNAETDGAKDPFICFGFEDMANNPKYSGNKAGDGDCNDVMFHVDVNPIRAIDPPPPVPEIGERYHTENRKGILAFEDNWPMKGDYDLNDVVVKYESKTTYVQATEDDVPVGPITLTSFEDKITLVHSGANYNNAFAYKTNISLSAVENITIDNAPYNPLTDGNGFIIKISDGVHNDLNTVKVSATEYTCTPKTFTVKVNFKEGNGITQSQFNSNKLGAPYNPYITTPKSGAEVHLPYYPPTSLADMNLFGTGDDRSNPATQLWYLGPDNTPYPFAVHLFNVDGYQKMPVETQPIDYTYPKYTNWVNSKFTEDLQWYNYPADVD